MYIYIYIYIYVDTHLQFIHIVQRTHSIPSYTTLHSAHDITLHGAVPYRRLHQVTRVRPVACHADSILHVYIYIYIQYILYYISYDITYSTYCVYIHILYMYTYYIYIYVHAYIHIHMHMCIYICIHIIYTYTYTYLYIQSRAILCSVRCFLPTRRGARAMRVWAPCILSSSWLLLTLMSVFVWW